MTKELDNFNIIITGGTGALGSVIAEEFLKSGAKIITNFRTRDKYERLKGQVTKPENLHGIEAALPGNRTGVFHQFTGLHRCGHRLRQHASPQEAVRAENRIPDVRVQAVPGRRTGLLPPLADAYRGEGAWHQQQIGRFR